MNVKRLCTCRGNGKVFMLVRIEGHNPNCTLNVDCGQASGTDIPCSILPFSPLETDPQRYVITVARIAAPSCKVTLKDIDSDGRVAAQCSYVLRFQAAKWSSRLNYRIKGNLSRSIRDFDKVDIFSRASMEFWEGVLDADAEEVVVHAIARVPNRSDNSLSVRCLDARLKTLPIQPVILGEDVSPLPFTTADSIRSVQLSLRVPRDASQVICLLEDANHPEFNSFDALDRPSLDALCSATWERIGPVANKPSGYEIWTKEHAANKAALAKQRNLDLKGAPSFSIVVPLYKTPLPLLDDMVESVRAQSYEQWELILVNSTPDDKALASAILGYAREDPRIKVLTLSHNMGISLNTNHGIGAASGTFICFLDHDDAIEPDALFEYAEAVIDNPTTDLIYSDEDNLTPEGAYVNPFFKPDFNIDLLRNVNYVCHFLAIRTELLRTLEPSDPSVDGAQDHDITLKAAERARHIHHVPRILYHWRMAEGSTALDPSSKSYAAQAGVNAVQNHLNRLGIEAEVSESFDTLPFTYRVRYAIPKPEPLVSIIIPSKDHVDILDECLKSIVEMSTYSNYEILVVENNSDAPDTFEYYARLGGRFGDRVRVIKWPGEFNFSKIINYGVSNAKGEYLLLLNNDTKVITPDWISVMLGICCREDVGAVGARLLYADGTLQHAGVWVSGHIAGHFFSGYPGSNPGYYGLAMRTQDLTAVTGACMMTKRSAFTLVDGFTEDFAVAFNDVDYCLKLRDKGLLVVYSPEAELYHYESLSRGKEIGIEKQTRFHRELGLLNSVWADHFTRGDPYVNKNILEGNPYYQVWNG